MRTRRTFCITFLLLCTTICCAKKVPSIDSLFNEINKKAIAEMSDGEYRYFMECLDDNDLEPECINPKLDIIRSKPLGSMNENEFDYFDKYIFSCDSTNPCILNQFLAVNNVSDFALTNRELSFKSSAKRECEHWIEHHPQTLQDKRRRSFKRARRIIGIGLALSALFTGGWIALSTPQSEHE